MVIYRTFSFEDIFKLWFFRIAIVAAVVYVSSHFNENPVVITVLVVVLTIIFFISGYQELIVYQDRFVYRNGWLLNLFRKHVFYYKDIHEITLDGISNETFDKIKNRLPNYIRNSANSIDITFVNKESKRVRIAINKLELIKAFLEIKKQLSYISAPKKN